MKAGDFHLGYRLQVTGYKLQTTGRSLLGSWLINRVLMRHIKYIGEKSE